MEIAKINFAKLLRPLVSVNSDFFLIFAVLEYAKKLLKILNSFRACSDLSAHAEHTGQQLLRTLSMQKELMRVLSMRVRN